MNAFAISSPLRQRISQDILDLQAEIGREAAVHTVHVNSKARALWRGRRRVSSKILPSELGPDCDLTFDDFVNFTHEDWQEGELCCSDGNSLSRELDPPGATTATASETVIGKPYCPSGGRAQRATPVILADCALRKRLFAFPDRYWHTLHTDGLFTQKRSQCIDPEEPECTRRLRDFSVLRTLLCGRMTICGSSYVLWPRSATWKTLKSSIRK